MKANAKYPTTNIRKNESPPAIISTALFDPWPAFFGLPAGASSSSTDSSSTSRRGGAFVAPTRADFTRPGRRRPCIGSSNGSREPELSSRGPNSSISCLGAFLAVPPEGANTSEHFGQRSFLPCAGFSFSLSFVLQAGHWVTNPPGMKASKDHRGRANRQPARDKDRIATKNRFVRALTNHCT